MKRYKYLIILLLSIFLIPFKVHAISTDNYNIISGIASSGGEITLSGDVTASSTLYINADFVLDLNGHTLDMRNYQVVVNMGDLTIKDSSTSKTGKLTYSGTNYFLINYMNFTLDGGTLESNGYGIAHQSDADTVTINGGKIVANKYGIINRKNFVMNGGEIEAGSYGVYNYTNSTFEMNGGKVKAVGDSVGISFYGDCSGVINDGEVEALDNKANAIAQFHNTDVTINGGTIKAYGNAVLGNGTLSYSNANLTVTGGSITSLYGAGIYAPQAESEIKITGGTIKGITGIEVRAGNLHVTGGFIEGDNDTYEVTGNTSGVTTKGSAISVSQHNTKQPIDVYICAGTFKGRVSFSEANPLNNDRQYIDQITMLIDEPCGELEFISTDPEKTVYSEDFTKFIKGGIYTVTVGDYWAEGYTERDYDGKKQVVKKHNVNIAEDSKNLVTVSESYVYPGTKVKLTTVDKKSYRTIIKVVDQDGNQITVTDNEFIMPNSDVTVSISYELINNPVTGDNIIYYAGALLLITIILLFKNKIKRKN